MAFHLHRLRRVLPQSRSLLEHYFHGCKAKPISSISACRIFPTAAATSQLIRRPFTSTTTLFRRAFDPEKDEIGPDTILFEGCDYNHWLITVDFPKDSNITREEMIETYVRIAAQIFGSVEEAKKRIYALSTTTYQGFQVECSEDVSEKFKSIPEVVFVLPDSYIDPVNKEYGGDKYVNGEIFPRPPPVHYGRRSNRDRRPQEQNYGPPPQQNYGPPPQQNYGPPPQQNYGPPPQQNYGPPPQQNYARPPQQNYGSPPPQQNYGPPPQQNYAQPPQQNFGTSALQNSARPPQQNSGAPPQPNFGAPSQPNFGAPPEHSFGVPPQQNFGAPQQQNFGIPHQQNYQQSPQQQSYMPPQQGYALHSHQSYGPSPLPQQSYVSNTQGNYGNSPNFTPHPKNSPAGPVGRSGYMPPNNISGHRDERDSFATYQRNLAEPDSLCTVAEEQSKSHALPRGALGAEQSQIHEPHRRLLGDEQSQINAPRRQRGFSQDADYGFPQDGAFGQVSGGRRNFSSSENN